MGIQVRPAESAEEREAVYRLVHDAYVASGWITSRPDSRLVHYGRMNEIPETTVLVAREDGLLAGTCSLTRDGPGGLHVDEDFHPEADLVRREGRRLAASWRIATAEGHRAGSRVIKALLWANVEFWRKYGIETCLMTFAPEHEAVYRRLLHCKTIAKVEATRSLSKPLVLMRFDWEDCPAYWQSGKHSYDIRV